MLKAIINKFKRHENSNKVTEGYIRHIDIDKLEAMMPPKDICEKDVIRLANSIFKHGILNPLPVYTDGTTYKYITGSRRIAASMLLGRKSIICHIYTDQDTSDNLLIASVMDKHYPDPFKIYDLICFFRDTRQLDDAQISDKLSISLASIKALKSLACFSSDERRKLSELRLDEKTLTELAKLTHKDTRIAVIDRLREEKSEQNGKVNKIVREMREENAVNKSKPSVLIDNTFEKVLERVRKIHKNAVLKKSEQNTSTTYTVIIDTQSTTARK